MKKILIIGVLMVVSAFGAPFLFADTSKSQAESVVVPTIIPTVTLMPSATPTPTLIPTPTIDYPRLQQKAALKVRLEYLNTMIGKYQQSYDFSSAVDKQMETDLDNTMKNGSGGYVVNASPLMESLNQAEGQTQQIKNKLDLYIEQKKEIEAQLSQL